MNLISQDDFVTSRSPCNFKVYNYQYAMSPICMSINYGIFLCKVFFYDGNVPCFSGQHLILAIPSLILFVTVVGLAPVFIVIISFKRFKVSHLRFSIEYTI